MSVELEISKLMTGPMGQTSGVGQVSSDGPMDDLLTQTMQTLTINPQTEIDQHQQSRPSREKKFVWQGAIQWQERSKIPNDLNGKVQRVLPCRVSPALRLGQPEVLRNAEKWPKKLQIQLIPKALLIEFGTTFLRQSSIAIFHLSNYVDSSEAVSSLKEIMQSGFVGCVHFPNVICDPRILILMPLNGLHTYVGYIPNDQTRYIAAIRNVVVDKLQIRHLNQSESVLQQAHQQLLELQRGPNNRPANMLHPRMCVTSNYWASRRGGRQSTWPRSRGGYSHGSDVIFVAERSSPYPSNLVPISTMIVPHSVTEPKEEQNQMTIEQDRQSWLQAVLKQTEEQVLLKQMRLQQPPSLLNNATNTSIPQLRELLQSSHPTMPYMPTMQLPTMPGQLSGVTEMGQGPGNGQPPPANPGGSIFPDDVMK